MAAAAVAAMSVSPQRATRLHVGTASIMTVTEALIQQMQTATSVASAHWVSVVTHVYLVLTVVLVTAAGSQAEGHVRIKVRGLDIYSF